MKQFETSYIGIALLLAIMFLATVVVTLIAAQPSMAQVEWEEESRTVWSGDTLWSLSGEYCPEGVKRTEWVDCVKDLNGLRSSIIYPGDILTVLVPVDGR